MIIPNLQLEKPRLSDFTKRPQREREGYLGPKSQVCLASEPLLIIIRVDDKRDKNEELLH